MIDNPQEFYSRIAGVIRGIGGAHSRFAGDIIP
jgi:hypothetical protein